MTEKPSKKLIVLGGSFNPPTLAHKMLLKDAIEKINADMGIFVPSSAQYVSRKMSRQRAYNHVYTEAERYDMLTHLCDNDPTLTISTCEYGDDGRGHTYDTLKKIQKLYPEYEIIFTVGADKLHIMPKWHNNNALFKEFSFAVATRNDSDKQSVFNTIMQTPKLREFSNHFYVIHTTDDISDVSSSKARQLIATKQWNALSNILDTKTISMVKA